MLRMPVATLRVWERRYQVAAPALTPSGQRLYSAADVRRLALLKQLADLGHAIGSLARLDMLQLQAVAATHAGVLAGAQAGEPARSPEPPSAWRLAVVGAALAKRLQRPALLSQLRRPVELAGPFDSVAQAGEALAGRHVDALLLQVPAVHDNWLADMDAAAPALAAVPKAVLYGFAAEPACDRLAAAGVALLRAPQGDAVLGQWLQLLSMPGVAGLPALTHEPWPPPWGGRPVPPRRWDDAALADFAGLSSTIACECPRHLAELLMQLSHFEDYSAQCQQRGAADARLHAYLQQVTAAARASFEAALQRVAEHEGLLIAAQPGVR